MMALPTYRAALLGGSRTYPLLSQLAAMWDFESLLVDVSGGGNTLTNINAVTQAAGLVGQAASFSLAASQRLIIASPGPALLFGTGVPMTVLAWAKLTSKATYQQLIASYNGGGANRRCYLGYDQGADRWTLVVSNDGNSTTTQNAVTFGSVATGAWNMVLGQYDLARLGISVNNGTLDSQAYTSDIWAGGTAPFELGSYANGSAFLDGLEDQVAIWKRVLLSPEKTFVYNGGAGRSFLEISSYSAFQILIDNTLAPLRRRGLRVPAAEAWLPRIPAALRGRCGSRLPGLASRPAFA